MTNCLNCNKETKNLKFCSKSCSASYNNKGVRRHGNPAGTCIVCGEPKGDSKRKYCSNACQASTRKVSNETLKKSAAARQARYRAKHGYLRAYAPGANQQLIKKIYDNCPEGHEVDHIIPLSKGGLHHENNLQYLTISENRKKGNKL